MINAQHTLGDIIKQQMTTLRDEIKLDLETFRNDAKADVAAFREEFRAEVTSLRSAQTETTVTIKEMENTLSRHDTDINRLESVRAELKGEIGKLQDRNEDLENRSRRQNLRIIGIPEDAENGKPTSFMAWFFWRS
ncbi:hypothetical protein LDENG_00097280 [Lucifuga dentata]|nr:hypothetical protein LDENG_00097280 [Lucifuga dentata]